MKKLTAGIFATLLAVVSADSAYAAIASSGYVDEKVGEVQTAVTEVEGDVSTLQTTVAGKADKATTLSGYGITDAYTSAKGTALEGRVSAVEAPKAQVAANVTGPVSGGTVYTAIQGVSGNVGTVTSDVEALKEDMTQAQTDISDLQEASATHATKTELAGKQDKLSQTGSASQPVYVNAEGKVTAGNTIPTVTTSITTGQTGAAQAGAVATALAAKANTADLGALATLNAVGSAQITDGAVATADIASKAVTKEKLADEIVTSLGKADTALQDADLAPYQTKVAADAAYAVKALEDQVGDVSATNMGTTATTVVTAIKEVAGEAAGAQSAVDTVEATIGAYGDIVTHDADEFATAAQGTKADTAVQPAAISDMLTKTEAGTTYYTKTSGDALAGRVTTAEGEIDAIQAEMDTMATTETVTNLTNRVTTAEGDITALETAVNDAESGLAATNTIADSALSTAQSAQTTANAALPKTTYNTQVGTVSATNMGTTATTVVAAIKEVKTTADGANTAAGAAQDAADAAQEAAEAAQATANAAIPKPSGECEDPANKCVLTWNNSAYAWEVIERGAAE